MLGHNILLLGPPNKNSKSGFIIKRHFYLYCHVWENLAPALALAPAPVPAVALGPAPVLLLVFLLLSGLLLAPAAALARAVPAFALTLALAPTLASAVALALAPALALIALASPQIQYGHYKVGWFEGDLLECAFINGRVFSKFGNDYSKMLTTDTHTINKATRHPPEFLQEMQ